MGVKPASLRLLPVGAEVRDLRTTCALPGLMDTHVQIIFPGDGQKVYRFAIMSKVCIFILPRLSFRSSISGWIDRQYITKAVPNWVVKLMTFGYPA